MNYHHPSKPGSPPSPFTPMDSQPAPLVSSLSQPIHPPPPPPPPGGMAADGTAFGLSAPSSSSPCMRRMVLQKCSKHEAACLVLLRRPLPPFEIPLSLLLLESSILLLLGAMFFRLPSFLCASTANQMQLLPFLLLRLTAGEEWKRRGRRRELEWSGYLSHPQWHKRREKKKENRMHLRRGKAR